MIKVRDEEATEEVLIFLKVLKTRQMELVSEKKVYYPSISIYLALKHKILFKNLLLHPLVLVKRHYYDDKKIDISLEELVQKLSEILSYEFTEDIQFLTDEETKKIIKVHKKLKANIEKSNVL